MLTLTCSENDIIKDQLYEKLVMNYLLEPRTLETFEKHLRYEQYFKLLRTLSFLKVFYLKQFPSGFPDDELKLKIDQLDLAVRDLKK